MLLDRLNWRYATKKMDPTRSVPADKIDAIVEAARLAPTSSGLQPFEIILVTNPDVKIALQAAGFGQSQFVDGSHIMVFAAWDNYTEARIDGVVAEAAEARGGISEGLTTYYDNLKGMYLPRDAQVNFEHAARQAYIALGLALTAAAFADVDSTPMEGFDPAQVDEILGLRARGLKSVAILALGYRDAEGDWLAGLPKVRRARSHFVTEVQ